ncbi:hypothetical protein ALI22I_22480 [Saccharothrix sp. ALI-22-I]|uniref:hypothetical protein n=1 Tax=Saccharothrix sp. ALI-22-I TaxID=1933778 RepID=UPI00097C5C58|nr:hypothetical protein [Saccharothrix sp. ALI-22-I]ONI87217.1 hypothetical protein ALI22I_22480 [Saccharothrix sp. ALI-22-I]
MPRPGTLTAAAVLWIITGVLLTVSYGSAALRAFLDGNDVMAAVASVLTVAAVVIWQLGRGLRHGSDNRTALTVLSLVGLGLFPLVLAAIVLQYVPASRQWFAMPPAETTP